MLLLASYSCCCFCCCLVGSACCRCRCWLQLLLLWLLRLRLRLVGWLCVAMCWLCWGRIGGALLALSFSLGHGMLRFPARLLLPGLKSPSVVPLPSFRHSPLGHKWAYMTSGPSIQFSRLCKSHALPSTPPDLFEEWLRRAIIAWRSCFSLTLAVRYLSQSNRFNALQGTWRSVLIKGHKDLAKPLFKTARLASMTEGMDPVGRGSASHDSYAGIAFQ